MLKETNNLTEENFDNLDCPYCGREFTKTNKPLVMKCSHNLCQSCHKLNKSKLTCLICHVKFEGKVLKRFPINFLLLEIIEKSNVDSNNSNIHLDKKHSRKLKRSHSKINTDENIEDIFHCLTCNLIFPNVFHHSLFPDHIINKEIKEHLKNENSKQNLLTKSNNLMNDYKNFNQKLEKANETFFVNLIKIFVKNKEIIITELKKNDFLDILIIFGIIDKNDKERINEFKEKYSNNEKIISLYNKTNSFDEIFQENKEIKLHHFFSCYFYVEEILNKKLHPDLVEEKLIEFSNNLQNDSNLQIKLLFERLASDVNVDVYNSLSLENDLNKNIKLPSILTKSENNLIIFDPMTESLKTFKNIKKFFPEEFIKIDKFSYYINSDYLLYITGGTLNEDSENSIKLVNCFSINLNNNEVKVLNNMIEARYNHSSIVINNRLYVLGGFGIKNNKMKSFARFNINENNWIKLTNCPHEFTNKPTLLNFEDEYIYIFDDLSHFFYYELKTDRWTICKPSYRGSYHLKLKNFTTYVYDSNVVILGGINYMNEDSNVIETLNENLYHLNDIGCLIKSKGVFRMSNLSSYINYGFIIDSHYLLEYSDLTKSIKVYHSKDLSSFKWDLIIENKEE